MAMKPPPVSNTKDDYTHHTSPTKADAPQVVVPKTSREITGTRYSPKLPDHVTKHPNPVGRPKNPRG